MVLERDTAASGVGEVAILAEYRRRVWLERMAGVVTDLLVIAAVYLIVTKPGL